MNTTAPDAISADVLPYKKRIDNVRRRAKEMGVINMHFDGAETPDYIELYENALNALEKDMDFILNNCK